MRHPVWLVAAILAVLGLLAWHGGDAGYFALGGLASALSRGLIALAFFLALARLTSYLTLTLTPDLADAVSSNPVARALLSLAVLLASAVVTLAAFG